MAGRLPGHQAGGDDLPQRLHAPDILRAERAAGAGAAEANPLAGFTRHPVAYANANGRLAWPAHNGFLGPLQRLAEPEPANFDQDVYQVRRVEEDPTSAGLLKACRNMADLS